MDFLSRLLGGTGTERQSTSNNPQQRLARFKRVYDHIQQTYQRDPILANPLAAESIRTSFQRLTTILQDEARAPAPHLCLSFAASTQIYTTISRYGSTAQHEPIIKGAVDIFAALLDSEEEEFIANERFAHALMIFIDRTSGSGNLYVGEDTEGEIVELLFGIAAKIRLQPEILPVWFRKREPPRQRKVSDKGVKSNDFVGVTSKADFPLCYQLIDHVHHEGRIGDFARTGLLYIFESASKSPELEQWIVESDLPTLMASGLGALYSQLSRKLSILHPPDELPIILILSDYKEQRTPLDAENLFSTHCQGHLETFLSYLTFWQDVLEHCRSLDVRQTLLDHLQVLFLQQLLYPSMLESSDVDGGSSVAVLTYLKRILDSLDHVEMVNLILQYLLALPEQTRPRSPRAVSRRTSLLLLTQPEDEEDRPNPALFNLVDLLQSSVTSANPQTVISALKLATVVLGKNHPYAIDTLLQTIPAQAGEILRTHGALDAEMEAYMNLAEDIGGGTGIDEAYEGHLKDTMRLIESHVCSTNKLALNGLGIPSAPTIPSTGNREVHPHFIRPGDAFLAHLLSILEAFFTNNIEVNLALTETLINLLSCPQLRLEGFTSIDPSNYQFSAADSEQIDPSEPEPLQRIRQFRRRPTWSPSSTPLLLSKLQILQSQIRILRTQIQDFHEQVLSRKQAFRLHSEISDAIANAPLPSSRISQEISTHRRSQDRQTPLRSAAIPQRIYSRNPSRSQSPRGRAPTSSPGSSAAQERKKSVLSQYAPGLDNLSPSRSRVRSGEPPSRRAHSTQQQVETLLPQSLLTDVIEAANTEVLTRRIRFPLQSLEAVNDQIDGSSVSISEDSELEILSPVRRNDSVVDATGVGIRKASLSHILTNVVILQEFVLEVVAIMQVRASMFGEVRFA
ncbi:hypothetical protein EJ08DRAFT_687273 [Tothia fuscella]|uniref:FHF complex subunit HOOK-interacting protein C-terminal domain-containing protein n=1 Tax=Tothia fuscella TaxID=1048955 RepID=A0A9P4TZV2_9PEZI|nr:hypothetical protein EJ08DRAFT_687273 [Tothia fuscella]